jgi:hypothetical protein
MTSPQITILSRAARAAAAAQANVESARETEDALDSATEHADAIHDAELAWPLAIDTVSRSPVDPATWIVRYEAYAPTGEMTTLDAAYSPPRGRFSAREAIVVVCRHWQQECADRRDDLLAKALTQDVSVGYPAHVLRGIQQ